MGFKCGIVGLPNVGKSTLFNALTESSAAQAENYPFCTIEPNIGDVAVPDARLHQLARIAQSAQEIPARINFVDIAGLVGGASKGEGLGNQFLANIREVDAIAYVLRCFEDENITHVDGRVDPIADLQTVETELMLADLESLERRKPALEKRASGRDKEAMEMLPIANKALAQLEAGKCARTASVDKEEKKHWQMLQLLTAKPVFYIANVDEHSLDGNIYSQTLIDYAEAENTPAIVLCAKLEAELSTLEKDERIEFMQSLEMEQSGLDQLIRAGYDLLGLQTFFTAGPKESRAWTIMENTSAPQAAGSIHGDFERGFICAETIAYEDYIRFGGESAAKESGKLRQEGRHYIVKDGDVIHFRFNV